MHLLLGLLAACHHDGTPSTTGPGTTTDDTTVPPGDSGGGSPELTGLQGSIVLAEWPPDAVYTDTIVIGRALFTDQDHDVVNLADCLFVGDVCTADLGAPGDTVPSDDLAWLDGATFEDAGSSLVVGEASLPVTFAYGVPVYAGDAVFSGSTDLAWDGDLAAYEGTGVFSFPDSIHVTAPDPRQRVALGAGDTIDLKWTAGGNGDIYLRIGTEMRHLADDGEEVITPADLGLQPPLDSSLLVLSRKVFTNVDASGNDVWVETTSDQWLYVDYTDTDGWTELTVGTQVAETCADAGALPALVPGQYYGDLTGAANDHDLGTQNPVTGWETPGKDVVFPVTLTSGQSIDLTYTQQQFDASIYVLDASCDPHQALAGADDLVDGDPEHLVFTAPADGTYFVVLDGYADGGPYSLVFQ